MKNKRTFVSSVFVTAISLTLAFSAETQPRRPAPAAPAAQPAPAAKEQAKDPASAPPLAITGARVHTGTGEVLEDATILIDKGVIQKIGKGIPIPPAYEKSTGIGGVGIEVTPGLVDSLTEMGLVEVSLEPSSRGDDQGGKDPIRAAFRAADGYDPASTIIGVTRAEGVTSVGVVPTGGLFSGQSAWADLDGETRADALAKNQLAFHVRMGALEGDRGGPAASILRIREAFDDARTYAKNKAAWERNQSRAFSLSRLDLEALTDALSGKLPVVFHVDKASDILTVLDLAKEFGLRPVIAGGAEAWKVAKKLAEAKAPVIVNPIEPGPTSFDALGSRDDNAALLHAAGVSVVVTTGETHNARKLRQVAGNAVRAGLPHEAAIVAITRAPAEALGLGDKYGTIAPGKVANLVVWSADPLELSSSAAYVIIRGKLVDLSNRQNALFSRYRKLPAAR